MPRLVITAAFSDEDDLRFFRDRMVNAVEEVAYVAVNGNDDIGEPARADGTVEVEWEEEDDGD